MHVLEDDTGGLLPDPPGREDRTPPTDPTPISVLYTTATRTCCADVLARAPSLLIDDVFVTLQQGTGGEPAETSKMGSSQAINTTVHDGQSDNSVTVTTLSHPVFLPFLPRICLRTLMGCFATLEVEGGRSNPSDRAMRQPAAFAFC